MLHAIPIAVRRDPAMLHPSHAGVAPRGLEPRVVVADDDDCLREIVAEWLEDAGFAVAQSACGEACIDEAGREVPAAVLVDQHMEGIPGAEAIRILRARDPSLPIVSMTGDQDPGTTVALLTAGATAVLHKPFSREQLLACLRRVGARSAGTRAATQESTCP